MEKIDKRNSTRGQFKRTKRCIDKTPLLLVKKHMKTKSILDIKKRNWKRLRSIAEENNDETVYFPCTSTEWVEVETCEVEHDTFFGRIWKWLTRQS